MSEQTTATPSRAPKVFGFIGIAVLVLGFGILSKTSPVADAVEPEPAPAVTVTASPSAAPSPDATVACEPQYVQVEVSHENNRVDDKFKAKYIKATVEADNLDEARKNLLIEWAGSNAFVLATLASALGLYEDPNDWQALVEGNCLSSEGQLLHAQVEGALKASGTKTEEGQAPANGYNSGVSDDGVYGVAVSQGITGDRKAIKVTLSDGSVVWIMVRCGNVVYPEKPPLPPVPTDEKDWSKLKDNGWTPMGPGKQTDGKESERQKKNGDTSGNVIDDKVPSGTKSGDTTPDVKDKSTNAPGATPGGDDRSDDVVDPKVTNQDTGGTNGDTCIADPDTGKSNC